MKSATLGDLALIIIMVNNGLFNNSDDIENVNYSHFRVIFYNSYKIMIHYYV